jgi:hypothetical protein
MKKKLLIILGFLLVINFGRITAQTNIERGTIDKSSVEDKSSFPVDARIFLDKYYEANGIDPRKFEKPISLNKAASWNYKVNDVKSFYVLDFVTNAKYSTSFTCRAVGENCYIFVEDSSWAKYVDQNAVDSIRIAFDSKTPANANKGIYQTDVDVFGNPPDMDGDPKIIILVFNIRDGYKGSGGYTAGYFAPDNENGLVGNGKAEIYHVDCYPTNLKTNHGLQVALSTTAHEFQHMIHFNYIPTDVTIFNEGFSLTAEVICGYELYDQSLYAKESNIWFQTWRKDDITKVLTDYSRAARFGLYMLEQYGEKVFSQYLNNKTGSIFALGNAIQQVGGNRTYFTMLPDWFMANFLNDKNVDSHWGYNYPNLPQMEADTFVNPNQTYSGTLSNHAVKYFSFIGGSNLTFNFNNNGKSAIKIKAIKYGAGTPVVQDVTANTSFSIPDFGTTYNQVSFVVYLVDPSYNEVNYNYSFTSSGIFENNAIELKYDEADTKAPLGAFNLTANDTIAVFFNGMSGAKLDSVVVGLRNDKQITGKICRTKTTGERPGQQISDLFTLTGTSAPTTPFPVPWTNMAKIDLRNQNIDASKNFCVVFPYQGTGYNNIIVTEHTPSEYYHSLTYLNKPSSGNPGWYYLSVSSTSVGVYVVRAYLSFGPTDAKETVELLPSSYSLDQNYPNPFNPSTMINYTLPKAGNVQIKIFDSLGREVRSLINEEKNAGKYNVMWDAKDNYGRKISSGIYFYTITSGDFVQTKKMVLMK